LGKEQDPKVGNQPEEVVGLVAANVRTSAIVLKNSLAVVCGRVLGVFKPSTHKRSLNVVNSEESTF